MHFWIFEDAQRAKHLSLSLSNTLKDNVDKKD